jgi:hypothetical protein
MRTHFLIQIASLLCLTSVYVLQLIGGLHQDYQIYNIHVEHKQISMQTSALKNTWQSNL